MLDQLFQETDHKMDKAVETTEHELSALRTGRASAELLSGIQANAYGTDTPLNQLATISVPDASTIMVQPWDVSQLAAVEKAILAANLGITPQNDGKNVRLNIPPMTEETRKDMVKKAHAVAEHGKVAIRNVRRHTNDEIKKTEKNHDISEDERRSFLGKVQGKTDDHTKRIDALLEKKETEIMTV